MRPVETPSLRPAQLPTSRRKNTEVSGRSAGTRQGRGLELFEEPGPEGNTHFLVGLLSLGIWGLERNEYGCPDSTLERSCSLGSMCPLLSVRNMNNTEPHILQGKDPHPRHNKSLLLPWPDVFSFQWSRVRKRRKVRETYFVTICGFIRLDFGSFTMSDLCFHL